MSRRNLRRRFAIVAGARRGKTMNPFGELAFVWRIPETQVTSKLKNINR
jgi:hypothetical protein